MRIVSKLAAVTLVGVFAALARPAGATGTVVVQQRDGSIKKYTHVSIRIAKQELALTTSDGVGTLVVGKAACTKDGELLKCLPYDATLFQHGEKRRIVLSGGTVLLNPTRTKQPLSFSSATLPPRGVLMSIHSKAGTYVSLTGTVDEVQK